jgi:hypothetical protein
MTDSSDPEQQKAKQLGIALGDLVPIYQTECSNRSNLWAVYVVATFAAGGFVVTAQHDVRSFAKVALSLGFTAFTVGHMFLLWQNTSAIIALEGLLKCHEDDNSRSFLELFAGRTNRFLAYVPHVIIDACVLLVIWSKELTCWFKNCFYH